MGFSDTQTKKLRAKLNARHVRTRARNGCTLAYIEGWHVLAEANRIFGFDGWNRETVLSQCVWSETKPGACRAAYIAKVRILVRAGDSVVVREGSGSGDGHGASPAEAHDGALKAAETDATKRALATFGNAFGLALYDKGRSGVTRPRANTRAHALAPGDAAAKANDLPATEQTKVDKSTLLLSEPKRIRSRDHLGFVAHQPCLICGRKPAQAHHLRFAQPRAMNRKVSDEHVVPLCRTHHFELHQTGDEKIWWKTRKIDPLIVARKLWLERREGMEKA